MGLGLAQELEAMRREIDHENASARCHEARGFADRAGRIVEVVQHLVDDDEVEGVARERRRIDVALPQFDAPQAGLFEIGTCHREHGMAGIESHCATGTRCQQLQHAAGAGAEIDEIADPRRSQGIEHGSLDHRLGRMQGADAVPFGRKAREEGLRGLRALGAHGFEPGPVLQQLRIGPVEALEGRADDAQGRRPGR